MNPAWWTAFGPAGTSLTCGDGQHRLRWADGTLQALDHPDAEGEMVLAALGGSTSPCLDLVMTWGRHSDDLAVLAVGPRSASDHLVVPAAILDEIAATSGAAGRAHHGPGNPAARPGTSGHATVRLVASTTIYSSSSASYSSSSGRARRTASLGAFLRGHSGGSLVSRGGPPRARLMPTHPRAVGWRAGPAHLLGGFAADEARAELIRLLAHGTPFQFRLSAAVAHAWSADGEHASRAEHARPALTAALQGRLAPAAADWLDVEPDDVEVTIHDGAGWGELALGKTDGTDRLSARLPVGWLASVWAPGLAVVDRHLVVRLIDAAWPTARVLAVRRPGQDPAEKTVRHDNGHWSVTSR